MLSAVRSKLRTRATVENLCDEGFKSLKESLRGLGIISIRQVAPSDVKATSRVHLPQQGCLQAQGTAPRRQPNGSIDSHTSCLPTSAGSSGLRSEEDQ